MPVLTNNGTVSVNADLATNDYVKVIIGANGYVNFGGGTVSLVEDYGTYEKTIKTYTAVSAEPEVLQFPTGSLELRLAGATSPSLYLALEHVTIG
jgi:hypothetical protein